MLAVSYGAEERGGALVVAANLVAERPQDHRRVRAVPVDQRRHVAGFLLDGFVGHPALCRAGPEASMVMDIESKCEQLAAGCRSNGRRRRRRRRRRAMQCVTTCCARPP